MKIFNYEIKKVKKEKIVQIRRLNHQIDLVGDGWFLLESIELIAEIANIFNKLPEKLTLDEKVQIFELFFPEDITFKIID